MKRSKARIQKFLQVVMAATTALFLGAQPCLGQQATVDGQEEAPASSSKNRFKAPEPKETEETGSGNTWLIVGGVAALAVGAVALGSSGGSSGSSTDTTDTSDTSASDSTSSASSTSSTSETPETSDSSSTSSTDSTDSTDTVTEYVGPNVAGSDWHGTLIIENEGFEGTEAVTASIVQSGTYITIRTSSSLSYGSLFNGKISDNGYITVRDAQTQKIWTTFEGFATRSYIKIYDYVNGNTAFDRLVLSR